MIIVSSLSDDLASRATAVVAYPPYVLHHLPPGDLGPAVDETIVQGLGRAMPDLKIVDYFHAKGGMFAECDHRVVAVERATGDAVAILASRWYDDGLAFLHIATQLTGTRFQRTGLLKHMWAMHFREVSRSCRGFPSVIAWRTYNPVSFHTMHIFTRIPGVRMYPRIDAAAQDGDLRLMAARIAACVSHGLPFCGETGVIRGAASGVPADFYPVLQETRRPEVNRYFMTRLTPDDRLLCVLWIESAEGRRRILTAFGA